MNLKPFIAGIVLWSISAQGAITSIAVERASQDQTGSYPALNNLWRAAVPPYPLETEQGIGRLLNISGIDHDISNQLFTLHGHVYETRFEPDENAIVTYTFDVPTVVGELEVVQHMNGIAGVEGFVGDSLKGMTSIGLVTSHRGDLSGGDAFGEGERSVFNFTNRRTGLYFQFAIRMTRLEDGYAAYRAFPRRPSGWRIEPAIAAVLKPAEPRGTHWMLTISVASLIVLLCLLVILWRDRRRHLAEP